MAWVQADIDALKDAIKTGVTRVVYRDRTVEYRSLAEMIQLLAMMENEVAGGSAATATPRHSFAQFSKG